MAVFHVLFSPRHSRISFEHWSPRRMRLDRAFSASFCCISCVSASTNSEADSVLWKLESPLGADPDTVDGGVVCGVLCVCVSIILSFIHPSHPSSSSIASDQVYHSVLQLRILSSPFPNRSGYELVGSAPFNPWSSPSFFRPHSRGRVTG